MERILSLMLLMAVCVYASKPVEKNLFCPRVTEKDIIKQQESCKKVKHDLCTTDKSCHGGKKCCMNACRVRTCAKPVEVTSRKHPKDTGCPVNAFDLRIMCDYLDPVFHECRGDSECTGTKMCCLSGPCAVKKCLVPEKFRQGECRPYNRTMGPMQTGCSRYDEKKFECRKDFDCKGNMKCCADQCNMLKCTAPWKHSHGRLTEDTTYNLNSNTTSNATSTN